MFALQHSAIGADLASQQKKKSQQHVLMEEDGQIALLLMLFCGCSELGGNFFFLLSFFTITNLPIGSYLIYILGYQANGKCIPLIFLSLCSCCWMNV